MSQYHHGGSATGVAGADPLFDALDPLVRAGTLRPDQATAVLHAVAPVVTAARPWSAQERTTAALGVLGAALALGAVTIALSGEGGFQFKLFLVSAAGIVVVAGAAVAVRVLLPTSAAADWVGGVMTALAVLATGALILRLGEDTTAIDYLAGVLMVALGGVAYLLLRHSALTLPVVAGVLTLVAALLGDLVDTEPGGGDQPVLIVGLVLAGAGVAIAGAGWRLSSRNVTAMIGGAIAIASMLGTIYSLALFLVFAGVGDPTRRVPGVSDDIWIAMAVGLLVCAGLAGLHARTQFCGYAVLVVLGVVLLPAAAVSSVSSDHPARWAAALTATALLVIVAALAPTLLARRRPAATGDRQHP
ncbi:MAG: hypothetical protein M3419_00280 [Actinomycetota bacterium]|nr:hypothetical protein [Actinomycetota bacterium]